MALHAPILPETPCGFLPEFLGDMPYDPEVLLLDQLLEIDAEQSLVRCRMPVDADAPLTRSQRVHPLRHPRHANAGLIIHATGMIGFVHAYYLLGLRFDEGWVGWGTHIHRGVFRRMAVPGTPMEGLCRAERVHRGTRRIFIRYGLEFRQNGAICYQGEQTAAWICTPFER